MRRKRLQVDGGFRHLVTGLLETATLFAMLSALDWLPGNAFHTSLKACASPLAMTEVTVRWSAGSCLVFLVVLYFHDVMLQEREEIKSGYVTEG